MKSLNSNNLLSDLKKTLFAVYTVSANINRTCVQTAPVTKVFILQTRDWCHSKDLELRIPKHIRLVKIAHIRPEKIELKVRRAKFKMYVFEFWAPHNALLTVPVPGECAAIPHCPAAAIARGSPVAPSAVGLASIKAKWAWQIASLGQEIPRSRNVQSSDSPCCLAWAPKQWSPSSPSSLQQHKGLRPHNAQEWCEG